MIGTFAGGLLRFDGANFVEEKPSGERIMRITRVVCDELRVESGHVRQRTLALRKRHLVPYDVG